MVRITVPRVPLAHTTRSSTTESPRNEAVVSTFSDSHAGDWPRVALGASTGDRTASSRNRLCQREITMWWNLLGGLPRGNQASVSRPLCRLPAAGRPRCPLVDTRLPLLHAF